MAGLRRELTRALDLRERLRRRRFSARLVARLGEILSPGERAIVEQAAPVEQGDVDDTQPMRISEREQLIRLGLVRPAGT